MRGKRPAVTACLVALLACRASHAAPPERRCSELGAGCLCSEPLDNSDVYAPFHNPSDSSAKECGAMDATRGGIGTSELPVPFPAAATAKRAFRIDNDAGSNGKLVFYHLPDPFDLTGKTMCVRHYALYGKDHDPPGNIKIARIGGPQGTAWQSSWGTGAAGAPEVTVVADPGGLGRPVGCKLPAEGDASTQVGFSDCQQHWCRFEICMEHDRSTGEHTFRAKWTEVGGAREHVSRGNCGAKPSPGSFVLGGFAEVVEYTTTAPPPSNGGSRYLSHAMFAVRPFEPEFWIGPACEIEGGCKP